MRRLQAAAWLWRDPWEGNERAMMRLAVIIVVALLVAQAAAAAPSFHGYTGLLRVPTADTLDLNEFNLGWFDVDLTGGDENAYAAKPPTWSRARWRRGACVSPTARSRAHARTLASAAASWTGRSSGRPRCWATR